MTSEKTTLVAVYDSYATAQKVQAELIQGGFSKQDVQVTSQEGESTMTATNGGSLATDGSGVEHHEGGISGFFHNLFGGHSDAEKDGGYYTSAVTRGNAVVTATIDDSKVDAATMILDKYDPVDFDQQVDTATSGTTGRTVTGNTMQAAGDRVIPIVEEELMVGKRSVQRGGVRVYSRVTETPVTEDISLHEEHARVERRPVNRAATESDFRMDGEVVEVMETAEEAVVGKSARVVEEVVVGRDSSDRTQTISDTVRHTHVEVERISPEVEQDFRKDYQTRYANQGEYDTYEPAYGYGYGLSSDPRFSGKSWNDVEDSAKSDYVRTNPNSPWDKVSNAVKYGWDKSTNKH